MVVREGREPRMVGGMRTVGGVYASEVATMLRDIADDIERAAKDGPRFEGDAP